MESEHAVIVGVDELLGTGGEDSSIVVVVTLLTVILKNQVSDTLPTGH